jgi:hypothetical protein
MSENHKTDANEQRIPENSTVGNEEELREQRREHTLEEKEASDLEHAEEGAEQAADAKAEKYEKDGKPILPKPTFSTFILSLASSALVQLGEVPDPTSGQLAEDQAMAKHSIDILAMLRDKIDNGLDVEEKRLLEGLLYELRMKYVQKN